MKRAMTYCRFSPRPDEKKCESNSKQEARCRLYCQEKGYEVLSNFVDSAVSGAALHRPGLSAAISALQPGMILVADSRDRLARDMLVSLTIHQQVKERKATIEIADGSPSRETPEGNLMANILDAFAQYDRERFARRTKAGLAKKRKDGMWLGKPPVGWVFDEGTKQLTEDAEEQRVITKIMALHNINYTSSDIASYLYSFGECCRGKPWSPRTIRKIIAREKGKKENA